MPRVVFGVTVPVTAVAFLRGQLSELISRGWDTHLVTSPGAELAELESISGLHVHEIRMQREPDPLHDVVSLMRWWTLIGSLKPDIVVASTPKASLLSLVAAWSRRVPVRIYYVRGLRAEGATGVVRRISLLAEKVSVLLSSYVVADSQSLLGQMQTKTGLKPQKGSVLGLGSSGVDTNRFRRPEPAESVAARAALALTSHDLLIVGFVGRVTKDKGIVELIDAIKYVRKLEPRVQLVLTGPVEDATLLPLLEEEWITATKTFTDPVTTYWASDVMCFPTYREGFGLAALEAQACGVPVITTTATGAINSIRDHETGILVPARNSQQLGQAILGLLSNRQVRLVMSVAARQWVEDNFEADLVQRRWADLIESSLASDKHS